MTLPKQQLWLVEVFQNYRKKYKLPNYSADDLTSSPLREKLELRHIDWLQQFIVVWEAVEYDVNQDSGNT